MLGMDAWFSKLKGQSDLDAQSAELTNEYWHRPGQLVVHGGASAALEGELERWDASPGDPAPERLLEYEIPVEIYRVPARINVHTLCRRFTEVSGGPEPLVGPNHVLGATQGFGWGPADLARPAAAGSDLPDPVDDGIVVGVIDTGLVLSDHAQGHNPHRDAHARMVLDETLDEDPLDTEPNDGLLDPTDVHGGFIVDIVRRHAPRAVVRATRGLIGGINDEVAIADAILRLWRGVKDEGRDLHVLNLSLGGYTDRNVAPWPIVEALSRIHPRPVVVAAAGNHSSRRPFWPAALKGVIGVGAVDVAGNGSTPPPAAFTNRGSWVDACASGQDVHSTFVNFTERQDSAADGEPQRFEGWATWSGTSFAAPHVAARIADHAADLTASDPFEAVWRAAWDLVWSRTPTHGPDLGVYVPVS